MDKKGKQAPLCKIALHKSLARKNCTQRTHKFFLYLFLFTILLSVNLTFWS